MSSPARRELGKLKKDGPVQIGTRRQPAGPACKEPSAALATGRRDRIQDWRVTAMTMQIELPKGAMILAEMQEFGSFEFETQRYVCRSLDVACSQQGVVERWARSDNEAAAIRAQRDIYRLLRVIRESIPPDGVFAAADRLLFPLFATTVFDLGGGSLATFSHYRFLYERLLGAGIRPWLPSAFGAAAALPHILPDQRRALFMSLSGAVTDRWSPLQPAFYPEWLAD
jgi:hypothetical protein